MVIIVARNKFFRFVDNYEIFRVEKDNMNKTIQAPLVPFEEQSIISRNISYHETMNDQKTLCQSRQIVYDAILSHTCKGGITDQDIANITGMPLSSVNARRNEINKVLERNQIVDNGSIQYFDDRGRSRMRTLWVIKKC